MSVSGEGLGVVATTLVLCRKSVESHYFGDSLLFKAGQFDQAEHPGNIQRIVFSTGLGSKCLNYSRDFFLLCVYFTAGAPSTWAAHILHTAEVVATGQQHAIAVELQILCSAFLQTEK